MCRTAILAIALAALTAGVAHAASNAASAKPHPKATTAAALPATRHASPAHSRHDAAPAQTRTQTRIPTHIQPHAQSHVTTTRKPTSRQSARTAGLAIRRQLAQRQAARRNVAFHPVFSAAASRPESVRTHHFTSSAPAMDVASAPPVTLLRSAPAIEPRQAEETAPADKAAAAEKLQPTPTHAAPPDAEIPETESPEAETPEADLPDAQTPDPKTEEALLRAPIRGMPAPLLGSHESLERQNTRLDAEGLERIEDESDLADRIARKLLVPLPASSALAVNPELPATHRYCRPWTALFLADLARAHAAAFHRPLEVSSAVRTMEYQKRLMQINGNAAPAEGDIVSPHLTGATIDIAKDGLSREEIAWMRRRLLALEASGKIDVEEEFRQACFHITVYKNYAPAHTSGPATQAGSGSTGSKHHKAADPSIAVAAQGL